MEGYLLLWPEERGALKSFKKGHLFKEQKNLFVQFAYAMPYKGEETYYIIVYFRMEKLRISDKFFAKSTLIRQVVAHCFAL